MIMNKSNEEKDRKLPMLGQITTSEQHFNSLRTIIKGAKPNHIAPDGSEIRTLLQFPSGGLAHCTLPPGATTQAVKHCSVLEIWYVIAGVGEIWRKLEDAETFTPLIPGTSINIPVGTYFQFRNTGAVPLEILLSTMPAWPGPEEAIVVENMW